VTSQENVEPLREPIASAQQAFNNGDFETAFALLAPNVEWHFGSWMFDSSVLTSREDVIAYYEDLRDSGDWQIEGLEIVEADRRRLVIRLRGRFAGRISSLGGRQESFQVWDLGAGGLVTRVREYESRAEALDAADLE
jgi:hypothetical protein